MIHEIFTNSNKNMFDIYHEVRGVNTVNYVQVKFFGHLGFDKDL